MKKVVLWCCCPDDRYVIRRMVKLIEERFDLEIVFVDKPEVVLEKIEEYKENLSLVVIEPDNFTFSDNIQRDWLSRAELIDWSGYKAVMILYYLLSVEDIPLIILGNSNASGYGGVYSSVEQVYSDRVRSFLTIWRQKLAGNYLQKPVAVNELEEKIRKVLKV